MGENLIPILTGVGLFLVALGIVAISVSVIRRNWSILPKALLSIATGGILTVMVVFYPHYVGLAYPPNVQPLVEIADSVNDAYVANIYDCSDMAAAFWQKATSEGYRVRIGVGNLDRDISSIEEANHAWCLVWLENGWLAIEVTGAFPVYEEENPRYYRGIFFDSPSELPWYVRETCS